MTDSPSLEPQVPVLNPSIDSLRAKKALKDTIKAETRALHGSDQVDYGDFVDLEDEYEVEQSAESRKYYH
jgi:hypothetical protein